jgi:hypothetical protein
MKKKFYKAANLLLSSAICLLGFNSCKTTQDKQRTQELPNEERMERIDTGVRVMYGVPTPEKIKRPDKEIKVIYGPPR